MRDITKNLPVSKEATTVRTVQLSPKKITTSLESKKNKTDDPQTSGSFLTSPLKVEEKQESKGSIKKESKIIVNKNMQSNIYAIEPQRKDSLLIYFKTKELPAVMDRNAIIHFFNKREAELDETLKNKIRTLYENVFQKFDSTQPRLTQADVNQIYLDVYLIIYKAKNKAIELGKPLNIIIGEDHYDPNSLLYELIVMEIGELLGLGTVCLELPPKDILLTYSPLDSTGHNLDFLELLLRKKINIVPIDNEEYRKITLQLLETQSSVIEEKTDKDSYGKLCDLNEELRDRQMVENIVRTTLDGGTIKNDLRVTVIGGDHLKGLVEDSKIMSDLYHILPLNCTGQDDFNDGPFYYLSSYNNQSRFFCLHSEKVIKLRTNKDCFCYTNIELYKMVLTASQLFQDNQLNLFEKEYTAIKENISEAIQESKIKDEEMLSFNLDRVTESIYNDQASFPSVKRMELRSAIIDTLSVMKRKELLQEDSVLYKKIVKINNVLDLEVTPTLTVSEYKNLRKHMYSFT